MINIIRHILVFAIIVILFIRIDWVAALCISGLIIGQEAHLYILKLHMKIIRELKIKRSNDNS